MDLKDIRQIVELMKRNELTVFQLEREEFKLLIKKGSTGRPGAEGGYTVMAPPMPYPASVPAPVPLPAAAAHEAGSPASAAEAKSSRGKEITSPMVGTFYVAPSPESAPFVKVGQQVTEDTVVCIIEAMKVLNEVKAEVKGTIVEIIAENGKPVQFGAPLFRVELS